MRVPPLPSPQVPQCSGTPRRTLRHSQGASTGPTGLPDCSPYPNREKGNIKPYFVLLTIYCKEHLKHFFFFRKYSKARWKSVFYLSIESWVQYVTVGNPLPLCKLWNPKCRSVWCFQQKEKENMVQIKFSKDISPLIGLIVFIAHTQIHKDFSVKNEGKFGSVPFGGRTTR